MGCVDCGSVESVPNDFRLQDLLGLFENPLNVVVSEPFIVYYKKWIIQVSVEYDNPENEGERITKKIVIGEIN